MERLESFYTCHLLSLDPPEQKSEEEVLEEGRTYVRGIMGARKLKGEGGTSLIGYG